MLLNNNTASNEIGDLNSGLQYSSEQQLKNSQPQPGEINQNPSIKITQIPRIHQRLITGTKQVNYETPNCNFKVAEGVENAVRDAFGEFEGGEEEDLSYFWEEFKKRLKLCALDGGGGGLCRPKYITHHKEILLSLKLKVVLDGEDISGSGLVVNCGGESSSAGDVLKWGKGLSPFRETVVGQESGTREDIVCEAEVHVKRNGSVESKSGSDIQIVHEIVAEANGSAEEAAVASENNSDLENPLDWDDFDSAVEIQVLGLERLKAELRAHGLKCGGMLQRACF
ncbi:hypothetical protein MKW92_047420 [Papaver armeniacum]|nr:hypothetical protein MKW92_047420 [Papaver armeniacum]